MARATVPMVKRLVVRTHCLQRAIKQRPPPPTDPSGRLMPRPLPALMKLTQFASAAIVVLLLVAGYLTVKSDLDSRQDAQNDFNKELLVRMDEIAKKQTVSPPITAPAAAIPVPEALTPAPLPQPPLSPAASEALAAAAAIPSDAPLAAENDPRMLEDERKVLNIGSADRLATDSLDLPATLEGQPLTKIQQRIVALPAIARVKQYAEKEGMLVLDRGSNVGLKPGDPFSLRRKTSVIGKVRISETIDTSECVADVLPGSMPPGMLPVAGDEVIQFE